MERSYSELQHKDDITALALAPTAWPADHVQGRLVPRRGWKCGNLEMAVGDRHILVLRNHGLLIVGTSIAAAFVATYRMERACAMQLAFQQSGAAFHPITEEVVTAAFDRPTGARNDPAKFEWPALLRKLDRIDPSYKQ